MPRIEPCAKRFASIRTRKRRRCRQLDGTHAVGPRHVVQQRDAHSASLAPALGIGQAMAHDARRPVPAGAATNISRLYAGIHYRFDSEVGLRMGRAIAALAVARENARGAVAFTNRVGGAAGF